MSEKRTEQLKKVLDRLYLSFDFEAARKNDPIEFPHRYERKDDVEIVAFISAVFAYGKVGLFKPKLESIFGKMGSSPADFIMHFNERKDPSRFDGFQYRFNSQEDLVLMFRVLRDLFFEEGSIGRAFRSRFAPVESTVKNALAGLVARMIEIAAKKGSPGSGFMQLLPSPEKGSACKRLNMFLRWMVRDRDIDFGLWTDIPKSRLIIPLDTHIARISRCLGLTGRTGSDWKTAEEITQSLGKLDPEDPLKYDFALCHQGISGICRADRSLCNQCRIKRIN